MNTSLNTGNKIYKKLIDELRAKILGGKYRPGDMIGSEYAFCRSYYMSRVSVRSAIDVLVTEGLVERRPGKGVFVRSGIPGNLRVQVIVPDLVMAHCVQISQGVRSGGGSSISEVSVSDSCGDPEAFARTLEKLPASGFDGAVIYALNIPEMPQLLSSLIIKKFPFVLVDKTMPGLNVSTVHSDNYGGGLLSGRELVKRGYRRIAFAGDFSASSCIERMQGLKDAMNDVAIPYERSLFIDIEVDNSVKDWTAAVSSATDKLLAMKPEVISYSNDVAAAIAFKHIRELGLRIPEDIGITGFDDDPLSSFLQPRLATVRQNSAQIGAAAVTELINCIKAYSSPSEYVARHITVPVDWIAGASIRS